MSISAISSTSRRRRFERADKPPPFRLTDDDVEIVRVVARHRLIRSTHIAELVGRSLDRTNDRLLRLFHAGYVDRPRAQLDRFPTSGSAHFIYALADRGMRLLRDEGGIEFRNTEWSRKNREAGRPFIEHQIEIVNFQVALQRAVAGQGDIRLLFADAMNAASSGRSVSESRAAFTLEAKLSHRGRQHETSVVPDLVFGLGLPRKERRNFVVEIDRGTMPVKRSDPEQTSFEGKMHVYLAAHTAKAHVQQFGWKNFRVLTVTTDHDRMRSMLDALRQLHVPHSIGSALFSFTTFDELRASDPLSHEWQDGNGRPARLF